MTNYEATKAILEDAARQEARQTYLAEQERLRVAEEKINEDQFYQRLYSKVKEPTISEFRQDLTNSYLTEALTIIVQNCLSPELVTENYHLALSRQLVTEFVKESGAFDLLRKFKTTSNLMSEVAYVVETTVEDIISEAKKDSSTIGKIPAKKNAEFYNKLSKVDAADAITKITDRIKKQEQDFVTSNMEQKTKIQAALNRTDKNIKKADEKLKEKINSEREAETAKKLTEAYIINGEKAVREIRNNHKRGVLEAMIYNLSKTAMLNESASKVFVENSKLNMEKVVEHCTTMCTFVTALDSLKIINADADYIKNMLSEMKK